MPGRHEMALPRVRAREIAIEPHIKRRKEKKRKEALAQGPQRNSTVLRWTAKWPQDTSQIPWRPTFHYSSVAMVNTTAASPPPPPRLPRVADAVVAAVDMVAEAAPDVTAEAALVGELDISGGLQMYCTILYLANESRYHDDRFFCAPRPPLRPSVEGQMQFTSRLMRYPYGSHDFVDHPASSQQPASTLSPAGVSFRVPVAVTARKRFASSFAAPYLRDWPKTSSGTAA
ncbi:hypothetical protein DL763_009913 [Monosporascus cannonballus]|nr:hypothetical protein DL763_009913 [Monosporascus cannonballus]